MPTASRYISLADLSIDIGISRAAAWRLVKSGALPYLQVGKRILLNKQDIDDFIANNTKQAVNPKTIINRLLQRNL